MTVATRSARWRQAIGRVAEVAAIAWRRYRGMLAIGGAAFCTAQLLLWWAQGAWPPHNSIAFWLAGRHLIEGVPVYGGDPVFLAFRYAPPWVVLLAPLSLLDPIVFSVLLMLGQLAALRWVAGSWTTMGLLGWLPFVTRAIGTGNIDLLMSAVILAAMLRMRGSGAAGVLFAMAKFSPIIAVHRWREAVVAGLVLVGITLPWLELWPAWWARQISTPSNLEMWIPILPRIPVVIALLALGIRRPWARAAAAGLATPAFYFHSPVLLFPAVRLWWQARNDRPATGGSATAPEAPSAATPEPDADAVGEPSAGA